MADESWEAACQEALGCQGTVVDSCLVVGEVGTISERGRRRSPTWSVDETVTLLNIWGQTETQRRLREIGRNRPIWIDVSKELEDNGYFRTWEQCKARVHNLESHYKKIKDGTVKKTGRGGVVWPYFEIFDKVYA